MVSTYFDLPPVCGKAGIKTGVGFRGTLLVDYSIISFFACSVGLLPCCTYCDGGMITYTHTLFMMNWRIGSRFGWFG